MSGLDFDFNWTPKQLTHKRGCYRHGREAHASVVLDQDNNNDNKDVVVAVVGGFVVGHGWSSSVISFSLSSMEWVNSPSMNVGRGRLVAVVCNGALYAISGCNSTDGDLDTMERISVTAFKRISTTASTTTSTTIGSTTQIPNQENVNNNDDDDDVDDNWELLNARLSSPRSACAAVTVRNRFIVVVGGIDTGCMDIIDTMPTTNHSCASVVVSVTVGPQLCVPRRFLGAVVFDNRIWVVGGYNDEDGVLDHVESISFHQQTLNDEKKDKSNINNKDHQIVLDGGCDDDDDDSRNNDDDTLFPSSSEWTKHPNLSLSTARQRHAVCLVGNCLIVAGGYHMFDRLRSVEALDLQRHVGWKLPDLPSPRTDCTMVSTATTTTKQQQHHQRLLLVVGDANAALLDAVSLEYVELTLTGLKRALLQEKNKKEATTTTRQKEERGTQSQSSLPMSKKLRLERQMHTLVFSHLTNHQ